MEPPTLIHCLAWFDNWWGSCDVRKASRFALRKAGVNRTVYLRERQKTPYPFSQRQSDQHFKEPGDKVPRSVGCWPQYSPDESSWLLQPESGPEQRWPPQSAYGLWCSAQ
jgi:hypothetical protein